MGLITARLSTLSRNCNYICWIKYVQYEIGYHYIDKHMFDRISKLKMAKEMFFCISYLLSPYRTTNQLLTSFQVISQMYKYTKLSSQNLQDLRFFLLFLYPHGRVLMHSLFWEVVLDMKVIYVRYVDWLKRSMWSCKLEGILMSSHLYLQTFYNLEQKTYSLIFLYLLDIWFKYNTSD